jgi:hypothetical protein
VRGAALALLALAACAPCRAAAAPVEVAAGIDVAEWERLLERYVDDAGLVDYAAWHAAAAHRAALRRFLAALAAPAEPKAAGPERVATLINAYNALTVSWILDNYPTQGIRRTDNPWKRRRHVVGGSAVSLDEIEHDTLRGMAGYRVHAALVCAARSCPPLARHAYRGSSLEAQLDARMRAWLSRSDLNRFDPGGGAELSRIFDWFEADFAATGGVRAAVLRHGPESARAALGRADARIRFLEYDWSLNELR